MRKFFKILGSRYFISAFFIILELVEIIVFTLFIFHFFAYMWILVAVTHLALFVYIVNMDTNPDHKIPWISTVLLLPLVGALLFSFFGKPTITKKDKKFFEKLESSKKEVFIFNQTLEKLSKEDTRAYQVAKSLSVDSNARIFQDTLSIYYQSGEHFFSDFLKDLQNAKDFIFMEYFIIEDGFMWQSILNILRQKRNEGVEIRVMYDDIGCLSTLPANYDKQLRKLGIKAIPFAKFTANANASHNNRSHRKITVIDGKIGYTGGLNLADEYINKIEKYGYWKDSAVRIWGDAVKGLTYLFLFNWDLANKAITEQRYYLDQDAGIQSNDGYYIAFGDGPAPFYKQEVTKSLYLNMINQATSYVYITTPYLIIDRELTNALTNAAKRGVKVAIVTPKIPDKKSIQLMSRASYLNLITQSVEIYEFIPGFIHAKNIMIDDCYAICGTINFDYRSLVHHYENAIWMYKTSQIQNMKEDFIQTVAASEFITVDKAKLPFGKKVTASLLRLFAPLL